MPRLGTVIAFLPDSCVDPRCISIESLTPELGKEGRYMSCNVLRFCRNCLMVGALLPAAIQFAPAGNAAVVSGSYSVLQSQDHGSHMQIRIRVHLKNEGPSDLSVQRMTLWDFSHPDKGGSIACALALRAHGSADTIQNLVLSRSDYQQWQKGFRPRFVLEMAGPQRRAR